MHTLISLVHSSSLVGIPIFIKSCGFFHLGDAFTAPLPGDMILALITTVQILKLASARALKHQCETGVTENFVPFSNIQNTLLTVTSDLESN